MGWKWKKTLTACFPWCWKTNQINVDVDDSYSVSMNTIDVMEDSKLISAGLISCQDTNEKKDLQEEPGENTSTILHQHQRADIHSFQEFRTCLDLCCAGPNDNYNGSAIPLSSTCVSSSLLDSDNESDVHVQLSDDQNDEIDDVRLRTHQRDESGYMTESAADCNLENDPTGADTSEPSLHTEKLRQVCRKQGAIPPGYETFWTQFDCDVLETRSLVNFGAFRISDELRVRDRLYTLPRSAKEERVTKVIKSGLVDKVRKFMHELTYGKTAVHFVGWKERQDGTSAIPLAGVQVPGSCANNSRPPIKPHSCPDCDPVWEELGI